VWSIVAAEAEAQHLAPLVNAGIQGGLADAPDEVARTLRAQSLRQLARHRTRTTAIAGVLREFDRRSIDVLLLKGAALAWMVYPSPALRPMGDVDVLVPKSSAQAAQQTLEVVPTPAGYLRLAELKLGPTYYSSALALRTRLRTNGRTYAKGRQCVAPSFSSAEPPASLGRLLQQLREASSEVPSRGVPESPST
jgi:hypothetical protein